VLVLQGNLLSDKEAGIMAAEAKVRGIKTIDDEKYIDIK